MKYFLSFPILCLVFGMAAACHSDHKTDGSQANAAVHRDSVSFRLALVPDAEAFPFYYAERAGIYDSLGLDVQIETYRSQMDCDTALLGGRMDGGMADVTRWKSYARRTAGARRVAQGRREWRLVACGSLRIRKPADLKGRMVAIARQSGEHEAMTKAAQGAGLKLSDFYRPQINDLHLRASMLTNNQVDAAMLCWPYTSLALSMGHKPVAGASAGKQPCWLVACRRSHMETLNKSAWFLLRRGYLMAQDSLRHPNRQVVAHVLRKDYKLPDGVADTVKIPLHSALQWDEKP